MTAYLTTKSTSEAPFLQLQFDLSKRNKRSKPGIDKGISRIFLQCSGADHRYLSKGNGEDPKMRPAIGSEFFANQIALAVEELSYFKRLGALRRQGAAVGCSNRV